MIGWDPSEIAEIGMRGDLLYDGIAWGLENLVVVKSNAAIVEKAFNTYAAQLTTCLEPNCRAVDNRVRDRGKSPLKLKYEERNKRSGPAKSR